MNPLPLMRIPCTITLRAPDREDEFGDEVLADLDSVETTCWLHQTQRSEITVDANTAIETWQLYLPPEADLESIDSVTVQGSVFEVLGPPHRWTHPRSGAVEYVEATIRKVADVVAS